MHTLILLTGKQSSGKSTLCRLLRNALEIEADGEPIQFVEKVIEKEKDYFKTIVISSQRQNSISQMNLFVWCRNYTTENQLKFLNINLDEKR